jgi:glycosyltransferase involved in cell wall biosynthesis
MNILILNWSGHYGGVEKHLLILAGGLDSQKYRLIFASPDNGPFPAMLIEAGYRWYNVPMRSGIDRESIGQLLRIIRAEGIDLIHAHQSRGLYLGGLATRLAGIKGVIQTEHNVSIDWYRRAGIPLRVRWGSNLLRYFFVRFVARKIVALSSGVASFYTKVMRVESRKITIIPYAHPVAAQPVRRELDPQAPIIGTVANLTEQKGLPYLTEAAAIVRQTHPEARFRIVGGGHLYEALAAQIARLGLQGTVELAGFQPNATAIMSEFDLFVLPSLWEPFGLVLLEAMANGLPIVATDVDGVADVVVDGKTGILVPPSNPQALAQGILQLVKDPVLARRMGQRGWERCASEFNVERMVARTAMVYEEVAAGLGG